MMNPPNFHSLVLVLFAFAAFPSLSVWFDVSTLELGSSSSFFVVAFSLKPPVSPSLLSGMTLPSSRTIPTAPFALKDHRRRGYGSLFQLLSTNSQRDGDDSDSMQQLQRRFDEAMKRRDERLSRMADSPTFLRNESSTDDQPITASEIIGDEDGDEQVMPSIIGDAPGDDTKRNDDDSIGTTLREYTPIEKYDEYSSNNDSDSTTRSTRIRTNMNDDVRPSKFSVRSYSMKNDWQDDDDDDSKRQYSSPHSDASEEYGDGYSGYDDPYDDGDYYYQEDDERYSTQSDLASCGWETYRSTSILFPPLPPSLLTDRRNGNREPPTTRPDAIIHFVGGTFFGSYPRKFYGTLLEEIARKCNAVVVATPIPLVLPGRGLVNQVGNWIFDESSSVISGEDVYSRRGENERERRRKGAGNTAATNPLDHISLAKAIQKEFNNAYRDVILDEYCRDYESDTEIEDFMRNVPIVGIGHSLGARIQAVSCSHPHVSKRYLSMGKGNRFIRTGREGMIYLGFANWGASSSIPGVATLDQTVKRRKQTRVIEERDRRGGGGVGRREDVWDNRSRRRRKGMNGDDMRRQYDRYDRYDADDLDLADVFGDVLSSIAKGAKQIGEAITPQAEDLEFSPTPNELWDDLSAPDGCYSQNCQNNLIVQFEDDPIDQGSRLARLLSAYNNEIAERNSTSTAADNVHNDERVHEVKFARLSGGHLTPVTLHGDIASSIPRGIVSLLSSSYNFILDQLVDGWMEKSIKSQQKEVEDLVDSVATYIQSLKGGN